MKIRSQVGMVLNLDKCIGCHTCSITCKNVWTSREGMEYAWFNNVETKPGIGYPKEWENQGKWKGGWVRNADGSINPRIGGKFYRPEVDAGFDEDRQRIWAVETQNPTLSTDFYLCTNIHTKPFVVTNQDPFEVVTQGEVFIEGNTVFGGHLVEATDDYEKVLALAPQDRIEKED